MFDSLAEKISNVFDKLRRSGILKEDDVDSALREIRIALLEADVSLAIAKQFIKDIKEKAVGQEITKSIAPGQMVVKIVHDYIVNLLGTQSEISLTKKPHKIMLVGLQGAGKTTTAAKLAQYFSKKNKNSTLGSTDIYRPAAIEQLKILVRKINTSFFAQESCVDKKMSCSEIVKLVLDTANEKKSDLIILDTAGRLHIDEFKMDELIETSKQFQPDEILLVVDIMTGQDSINIANFFSAALNLSGIILTRVDGDAKGGVALSMRYLTKCPIKFLCSGELLDNIEFFDSSRIADRILGMGDIVSLVEKAQENFSEEEALQTAKKMQDGVFTFDDLASQIEKMSNMGGLKAIIKMLPKSKEIENAMSFHGIDDNLIKKHLAIIRAMTKKEKINSKIINGSRKKRIAKGAGTTIQEVNKVIKQYEGTLDMLKKMKKSGGLSKIFANITR